MRKLLSQPEENISDQLDKSALNQFGDDKKFMNEVDHIVCLADYAKNLLCQYYGIELAKISVVNNGISDKSMTLTNEARSALKGRYMINNGEKVILFAGRLDEIKGILYLVKAFKNVLEHEPDTRLWIVGDGNYNLILSESENIWNKICFTGHISRERLFELYAIADLGVVPSLFEPFGYVAVEMMMHCLPVVVTSTTGLDEIVEDGISGVKVQVVRQNHKPEVDTEQLTRKIISLLQNQEERQRLGNNGRNRYLERFTSSLMCEKMENCYQMLFQANNGENH